MRPLDNKWLLLLLQGTGLSAKPAYTLVQVLRTMAAENVIARVES